ncbi:conserved hypothetical protein [Methanocella paludicola SANAE]|uniref:TFIIB-type zinc ribbon-containing protein n=1 Tax=Methanocella paludicola (strain DSM 17711 / JCM 13418 / NBRC 101707 / SANAE) TaxID=304371 RepID=D1Z283_METPS|nr:hypothetical protein [Methanocella paludicola]BAI62805.1 conserved hypothetical protein [Methanocella paludicola SANAE]
MTKIMPIVCPGCKNPMYGKDHDTVFLCQGCGTLHARDGKVTIIEYEAGAFAKPPEGEKVYLPFWKLGTDFRINSQRVEGGTISRFAGFLSGNSNAGHMDMFLPAFETETSRYKELAEKLTLTPPKYSPDRLDPTVKREPCTVEAEMADGMADFLFVTIEAEKPGTLQQLDYGLQVTSRKLVYLPYYKKGNDLVPGY